MWYFDKLRLSRACAASFKTKTLQMSFDQYLNTHRIFKRLAKALIRLRVRTGWSEPLLDAHTTLLEISCCGTNVLAWLARIHSYVTIPQYFNYTFCISSNFDFNFMMFPSLSRYHFYIKPVYISLEYAEQISRKLRTGYMF